MLSQKIEDISSRSLFKLIGASVLFAPTFAAAPFLVTLGVIGVLAVGIAFYFMALYVLPLAFVGMGAGYYLGVKKYPEKKLLLGAMGYLIGFQAGFQVVLWLAFPTSSGISSLAYLVGLAMIGVIVAFLISKIGSREVNNGMDPTPNDNHPLGQIHAFNRINNPQSQDLRIGVILALALVLGITLVIPFFSF